MAWNKYCWTGGMVTFLSVCASVLLSRPGGPDVHLFELRERPFSADPIDYDAFVHHTVFSSVHSSLVSQYKIGAITGILAKSWSNTNDFRSWKFEIRQGLTFENGDPVTPKAIVSSLNRMAYLLKVRGSNDGVLSEIVGFDSISSASHTMPGLIASENAIHFEFKSSVKDALEALSFGQYGVVHSSLFDPKSGIWLNKKQTISSSFYKVTQWNEKQLRLELRSDFLPEFVHPQPLKQILFDFSSGRKPEEIQLTVGTDELKKFASSHEFFGGSKSRILYLYCPRWNNVSSPCSDKTLRRALRDALYKQLGKAGMSVTRSFLPLTIQGVSEFSESSFERQIPLGLKLKVNYYFNIDPQSLDDRVIYNTAIDNLEREIGGHFERIDPNQKGLGEPVDIQPRMTGIRIDYPDRDLKFMFRSKEGIRLPDEDGKINQILENPSVNVSELNEELWEQGIVWPVRHVDYGIWAKKFQYDFSRLNTTLPPIELQWIGMK